MSKYIYEVRDITDDDRNMSLGVFTGLDKIKKQIKIDDEEGNPTSEYAEEFEKIEVIERPLDDWYSPGKKVLEVTRYYDEESDTWKRET